MQCANKDGTVAVKKGPMGRRTVSPSRTTSVTALDPWSSSTLSSALTPSSRTAATAGLVRRTVCRPPSRRTNLLRRRRPSPGTGGAGARTGSETADKVCSRLIDAALPAARTAGLTGDRVEQDGREDELADTGLAGDRWL